VAAVNRSFKPMIDSGSVVSTCPPWYAPGVATKETKYHLNLESVLGEKLKHYGFKEGVAYKNGRVEIIPNDQGNRITPSYVAFTEDERLIGEAAKNQATVNPSQTLFDVKRLIGRRFKDSTVQKDIKLLPFKIVDKGSKPFIAVNVKGEEKIMPPEEVSAMVLIKMKETAENYLGKEVKHAVITVPA